MNRVATCFIAFPMVAVRQIPCVVLEAARDVTELEPHRAQVSPQKRRGIDSRIDAEVDRNDNPTCAGPAMPLPVPGPCTREPVTS